MFESLVTGGILGLVVSGAITAGAIVKLLAGIAAVGGFAAWNALSSSEKKAKTASTERIEMAKLGIEEKKIKATEKQYGQERIFQQENIAQLMLEKSKTRGHEAKAGAAQRQASMIAMAIANMLQTEAGKQEGQREMIGSLMGGATSRSYGARPRTTEPGVSGASLIGMMRG